MVTRWGLSEALGTVAYGENQDEVFLGHSIARQQNISEHTAQIIARGGAQADRCGTRSRGEAILNAHRTDLDTLAQALLVYETLSGEDIGELLAGRTPAREPRPQAAVSTGAVASVSSNSSRRPALAMPMKVLTLCSSAAMIGASIPSTPAPDRTIKPKVNASPMETFT